MEYVRKDYFPVKNCRVRVREKQGKAKTQVPVGTEGVVFWIGEDEYRPGKRMGFKDSAGVTHWVHESFCDFSGYGLPFGQVPEDVEQWAGYILKGAIVVSTSPKDVTIVCRPAVSVKPTKVLPDYLADAWYAEPYKGDVSIWNVVDQNRQTICLIPVTVLGEIF
jgi:hypothetical protein